jgi:hypothetical protein
MPKSVSLGHLKLKAESARKAFEQEFERFARFRIEV